MSLAYMKKLLDKLPSKVKSDTIVEALFEIRFNSEIPNVADLLPGLLFPKLRKSYPKIESLPNASMIREISKKDKNFKYKPTHRLLGDSFTLFIGDDVILLSCPLPYQGWDRFRKEILLVLDHVKDIEFITDIERFSIKYINIIPNELAGHYSDAIDLDINLGPFEHSERGLVLRQEIIMNDFINVVQVAPNSEGITEGGNQLQGLLLDIDTIYTKKIGLDWDIISNNIDKAHLTEKTIYFNSLNEDSLKKLQPIWE